MNLAKTESLIAYLAAIAPALIQLIAVFSVGLANVLQLQKFLHTPDFLSAANFFVILLVLVLITLSSYWDNNKFSLMDIQDALHHSPAIIWRKLKIASIISFICICVFSIFGLNKEFYLFSFGLTSFLQWLSYIVGMTCISWIIYLYSIMKIQQRQAYNLQENYIPRLIDSLRRYGYVKNPDVVIEHIKRDDSQVFVRIDNKRYKVFTDFTGEMLAIENIE